MSGEPPPGEVPYTPGPESEALKLVATDDLIAELFARGGTCVVGMVRPHKTEPDMKTYKLRWKGDAFMAAGICSALEHEINRYRLETEDKINPEEF